MPRMRSVFAMTAATAVAGAVGYGLGLMLAPASGAETRRRMAWRAQDQYESASRACERMIARAMDRAKEEFGKQKERVLGCMGHEHTD